MLHPSFYRNVVVESDWIEAKEHGFAFLLYISCKAVSKLMRKVYILIVVFVMTVEPESPPLYTPTKTPLPLPMRTSCFTHFCLYTNPTRLWKLVMLNFCFRVINISGRAAGESLFGGCCRGPEVTFWFPSVHFFSFHFGLRSLDNLITTKYINMWAYETEIVSGAGSKGDGTDGQLRLYFFFLHFSFASMHNVIRDHALGWMLWLSLNGN